MTDLISRAAAIDAVKRAAYWNDAERKITELPAVDAVPVEWLRDKMSWADDEGDLDSVDLFSWIIQTWQKEQEAR